MDQVCLVGVQHKVEYFMKFFKGKFFKIVIITLGVFPQNRLDPIIQGSLVGSSMFRGRTAYLRSIFWKFSLGTIKLSNLEHVNQIGTS